MSKSSENNSNNLESETNEIYQQDTNNKQIEKTDGKDKQIMQGNQWLQLELSKHFGLIAITLMTLQRIVLAKYLDTRPPVYYIIYSIISLKIYSQLITFIIVIVTQPLVDFIVFNHFGQPFPKEFSDQSNYDYPISVILCIIIFFVNQIIPFLGLENRKKQALQNLRESTIPNSQKSSQKQEAEVHIIYHLLISCIAYASFMFLLNIFGVLYSPLSCLQSQNNDQSKDLIMIQQFQCKQPGQIDIYSELKQTLFYTILQIFEFGPLKVFLKVKEGKTSIQKIIEDYEDEKFNIIRQGDRQNNNGVLPTTSRPRQRTNIVQNQGQDQSDEQLHFR